MREELAIARFIKVMIWCQRDLNGDYLGDDVEGLLLGLRKSLPVRNPQFWAFRNRAYVFLFGSLVTEYKLPV